MSSFIKVNVSALSSCQGEFSDEQSYFNNNTYTTFSNGYICSCGDQYISQMASHMLTCYDTLKAGYTNINDWWTSYVSDVETLENVLSGQSDLGEITSPELIAALGKLYNTDNYNNTLEGEYTGEEDPSIFGIDDQSTINAAYNQNETGGGLLGTIVNGFKGLAKEYLTKVTDSCVDIYNEDGTLNVLNVVKNIGTIQSNMSKINMATGATVVSGFTEGVLNFGEALVDFGRICNTVVSTVPTALIDGAQAIYGKVTGKEWHSLTKKMWDDTKVFVAKKHVNTWFNNLYDDNFIGKSIKNNSIGFDTIRNVTSGIGYGAGVIALSAVTMGVGGAAVAGGAAAGSVAASNAAALTSAVIAGTAGIGKGTQNAWADGASTVKGLASGTASGIWEGIQYFVGAKINNLNVFGSDKVIKGTNIALNAGHANKALNIGARALLDGVDGGLEGFVQPIINAIYKNGYKDENGNFFAFSKNENFFSRYSKLFNENGGLSGVVTNAVVGAGISALTELPDLFKKTKVVEGEIVNNDNYIENPKPELPPNQTIIDVEGEKIGVDYETLDGDVIKDLPTGNKDLIEEFDAKGIGDGSIKGLPPGPDDIDVTTNSKNLTGDVSTEKLDIFKESEIPKTKVTGSSGDIETLGLGEAKPIAATSVATGDISVLQALDDADVPKKEISKISGEVKKINLEKPISIINESDKMKMAFSESRLEKSTVDSNITPLNFSESANPDNMRKISKEAVLYTPSISSKDPNYIISVFEETAGENFGCDQGVIRSWQRYQDDLGNIIYPGSTEYLDAIKSGKKLTILSNDDMRSVYSLLIGKHKMSVQDAIRAAELIDVDAGVCSYAATVDNLIMLFMDRQQEFYDKTGIPLFVKGNSKSGAIPNAAEMLADLYVTVNLDKNGGNYFTITPDGKKTFTKEITIDQWGNAFRKGESGQVYLSEIVNGVTNKNGIAINTYLRSNGIEDVFTQQNSFVYQFFDDIEKKKCFDEIMVGVDNGKQYELALEKTLNASNGIAVPVELRFLDYDTGEIIDNTLNWADGGHAVKLVGYDKNGFIVSTWGSKILLPFEDLYKNNFGYTEVGLYQIPTNQKKPKFSWKSIFGKKDSINLKQTQTMATIAPSAADTSILHAIDLDTSLAKGSHLIDNIETLNLKEVNLAGIEPIRHSQNANLDNMSTIKYTKPVLYTPDVDPKSTTYTRTVFEETADAIYGIGNDQGTLKSMQYYVNSYGRRIYPGTDEYLYAIKSGQKLTIHQDSWDMASVYNLLTSKYNMSFEDAVRTAQLIDVDEGVCTYAATLDNLTMLFLDKQQEFYDKTGISLFIKGDSKSGARINTPQILADLYVTVNSVQNGGKYFTVAPDGNTKFTSEITVDMWGNAYRDGDSAQVFLSHGYSGANIDTINKYLEKNGFTERIRKEYWRSGFKTKSKLSALTKALTKVENGKQIQMTIIADKNSKYAVRFFDKNGILDCTTKSWSEDFGHEVKIIGSTGSGVIISTWGKELVIPFEDIINSDVEFNFSHLYIENDRRFKFLWNK